MKTTEAASRVRSRLLVAGLLLILTVMIVRLAFREDAPVLQPAEVKAFNASAGSVLGRHLAERFPAGRVLIVVRPGADNGQGTAEEKSLLDGFQQAVAGRLQIAGIVAPPVPDWFREDVRRKVASGELQEHNVGSMMEATTLWYDMRVLADLLRSQPERPALLVSTTALPTDFPGAPDLAATLPPVALLLAPVLNMNQMLDSGRVESMVVFKPSRDWTSLDSPGADAARAFDSRYFLVHSGNREEMLHLYPEAFQ